MEFWRDAGSVLHPTAESQECYDAVYEALRTHISATLNYPSLKVMWEQRMEAATTKADKACWARKKPVEPSSQSLKNQIGSELIGRFPYMSHYRHMYKNVLQVNKVPSAI